MFSMAGGDCAVPPAAGHDIAAAGPRGADHEESAGTGLQAAAVRRRSGADEARDRLGRFVQLGVGLGTPPEGGFSHAVREVILKQPQRDSLERLGSCRHLGEDVDAIAVLVDHAGDAPDLAFDALQPLMVGVLSPAAGRPVVVTDSGIVVSSRRAAAKPRAGSGPE